MFFFDTQKKRGLALALMIFATIFWGLAFALCKSYWALIGQKSPQPLSSWFLASYTLLWRFALAGVLCLFVAAKSLKNITRSEIIQGLGLAFFGAGGLLLQMDALNYTDASVSAFLTQLYCVLIPMYKCFKLRQWPSKYLFLSVVFVLLGVGILSGANFHSFKLGRGEAETLISSVIFAFQILWLERPQFSRDNQLNASVVMFFATAVFMLLVALRFSVGLQDPAMVWTLGFSSVGAWIILGALVVFCTLLTFLIMVLYQPHIDATEAGLIYCIEPIFASVFALFLPGLIARQFGAQGLSAYENETLSLHLVVGGGLITLANVLLLSRRGNVYKNSPKTN